MIPEIRVKRIHSKAQHPTYASDGASGLDLRCVEDFDLVRGTTLLVPTGLCLEIPEWLEGQVRPRSGLAAKYGITVLNTPGTIDSDYRGEIKVLLHNTGDHTVQFSAGDRIAQLVISPVQRVTLIEAPLTESTRHDKGFGSTGLK